MKILFIDSSHVRNDLGPTHVYSIPRYAGWTGNNEKSWTKIFRGDQFRWEEQKKWLKEEFILPKNARVEDYDPGPKAAGRKMGYLFVYLDNDPDYVGYIVHNSYVEN